MLVALVLASTALAQVERYELGHRFRALESVAAEHSEPEQRARIKGDIDGALRCFFAMDLAGAARAIDDARLQLAFGGVTPERVRSATRLYVDVEAQLVSAEATRYRLTLDELYEVSDAESVDLTWHVELGRESVGRAVDELPCAIEVSIGDLTPGDHLLRWEVRCGEEIVVARVRTVSIARDLEPRISAILERTRTRASRMTIEQASARALARKCRALTRSRHQETDFPAARFLREAESALAAVDAGERFYDARRSGEFWLRVVTSRDTVAVRLAVPEGVDPAAPPAMVIAMHGAGGSENLFFEGENGLAPRLCAERGWYLCAPLSSPIAPPRLDALLDALGERYPFDRERVFVIGHSMGAMQAVREACRTPSRFRAIVAFGGGGRVERVDGLSEVDFLIGVGQHDFAHPSAVATRLALERLGADVTFREWREVGHVLVLQDGLAEAFVWLDAL